MEKERGRKEGKTKSREEGKKEEREGGREGKERKSYLTVSLISVWTIFTCKDKELIS